MSKVRAPQDMNYTFAAAFNSRDINNLLALYEPGAILVPDASGRRIEGIEAISQELSALLGAPGVMVSKNNFCIVSGDLALLRGDFVLQDGDKVIASGSTAELVRRQTDGSWLYVIDHAAGASLPTV